MLPETALGVHLDHYIIFFFWILQNALYDYRDSKSFWIDRSYFLLKPHSEFYYCDGNLKVYSLSFHSILLRLSFAVVFGKENKNFTSTFFFYLRENVTFQEVRDLNLKYLVYIKPLVSLLLNYGIFITSKSCMF